MPANSREERLFYHGTNQGAYGGEPITSFITNGERTGAYFSDSRPAAGQYGERIYSAFIKDRDPLVIDAGGRDWSGLSGAKVISGAAPQGLLDSLSRSIAEEEDATRALAELTGEKFESRKPLVTKAGQSLAGMGLVDFLGDRVTDVDSLAREAKRAGFSGIEVRNVIDEPVFDPTSKREPTTTRVVFDSNDIEIIDDAKSVGASGRGLARSLGLLGLVGLAGAPREAQAQGILDMLLPPTAEAFRAQGAGAGSDMPMTDEQYNEMVRMLNAR